MFILERASVVSLVMVQIRRCNQSGLVLVFPLLSCVVLRLPFLLDIDRNDHSNLACVQTLLISFQTCPKRDQQSLQAGYSNHEGLDLSNDLNLA